MAAFGAAHRLRAEGIASIAYDKQPHHGGHTASYIYHGKFIFDDGPHISFTRDERMQNLFAEWVDGHYEIVKADVNNYWQGHWIPHPAQCHLHGLPRDLVDRCIDDFKKAHHAEPGPIDNYEDWLLAAFGETFSRTFPWEYGTKYHTTTPDNMTTEWLGPRLYKPRLEEVLRGAESPEPQKVHYVDHFRYPSRGGFASYLAPLPGYTQLELNHEIAEIDPRSRTLRFASGGEAPDQSLISSIPLPALIPLVRGAPDDVAEAAGRLAATSCVMVNLAIDREDFSDAYWTYFYDRDIFFTRTSFPYKYSPHIVPPGTSSVQVEVYYSDKYRPLDRTPHDCIDPVMADLRRCSLLREDDTVLFVNATYCPYANVIFDLDRPAALATVHGYLDDLGIRYAGRYGEWGYHWTDESFISGENAAQSILDARG